MIDLNGIETRLNKEEALSEATLQRTQLSLLLSIAQNLAMVEANINTMMHSLEMIEGKA